MKRVLLFISLLSLTSTYAAENPFARKWTLGVNIGGAYSKAFDPQPYPLVSYKPLPGYTAGISTIKFTKSRLSIEIGLQYSVFGYTQNQDFSSGNFVNIENDKYPRYSTVKKQHHIYSIPFKLNFDLKRGNFQIFVSAGIAPGHSNVTEKGTMDYKDGSSENSSFKGKIGYTTITPSAGVGARLVLNEHFFTKAEISYGHTWILNSPDLRVTGVNLGLFYCFK